VTAAAAPIRLESAEQLDGRGDVPGAPALGPATLARDAPDATWILARPAGAAEARCSLWWTRTPELPGRRTGLVGHYAARDAAAARRLLDHACAELAAQGCTLAVGPMDGSTWRRYRLIVERSDEPVFFLEPDNPPDWPQHFLGAGFETLAGYFSAVSEDFGIDDPREAALEERLGARGLRVRALDASRPDDELRKIYRLSTASFTENFLYTPIGEEDFLDLYRPIVPHVPADLVLFAEREADPVGFVFGYPDLNRARRGVPMDTVVLKTLARVPGREWAGLGSLLLARFNLRAHELGFRRVVHALMHESNVSRTLSARWRGRTIRRYALFARALAP
jgi:GNAT superfamily N-acetyltransferase